MRAPKSNHRRLLATAAAIAVAAAAPAQAAPPEPCGGTPQITDPKGDGHHTNTDVLAAWLTESAGRLQAVIRVDYGLWEPAHEDSESAGWALLYELDGATRYVRAQAIRGTGVVYDTGTWTVAGGFAATGATTGEPATGPNGTVTLDVPAVAAGTVLARPFVLTYDGVGHWVDRAPGGTTADGTEFGADFVAGACPGVAPTPTAPGTTPVVTTTAVSLKAPSRRTGSGRARITGSVAPARAGVGVELTATARRAVVHRVTTRTDGTFALSLPVSETTRVRAVAEGRGSQTLTIQMYSRVRIEVRRRASGTVVVSGTTSPKLSGRILWLRTNAIQPSVRTTARDGRFRLTFRHPRRGRYQAVFIPSAGRAERSTSNTGVIR